MNFAYPIVPKEYLLQLKQETAQQRAQRFKSNPTSFANALKYVYSVQRKKQIFFYDPKLARLNLSVQKVYEIIYLRLRKIIKSFIFFLLLDIFAKVVLLPPVTGDERTRANETHSLGCIGFKLKINSHRTKRRRQRNRFGFVFLSRGFPQPYRFACLIPLPRFR